MMKTERMGMLAVALILLVVVAIALVRNCPRQEEEPLAPSQELIDSIKHDTIATDTIKPQKPRRERKKRPKPIQRPPRSHRDEIVN